MIVGTVKEIKNHEYRVGLTPESVHELTAHGHEVLVETGAGDGIGAHDALYEKAGARIVATAAEIFASAEMIVKVKEPQPGERAMLRAGQGWDGGFALLTSRCSYELVEKAALARCPMLATISAPTRLAVERAAAAGLALRTLVRADALLATESP